jgi:hypothetical protein
MFLFLMGCSSQKEEVNVFKPKAEIMGIAGDENQGVSSHEYVFDFEDQYYVKGASIDTAQRISDSAQVLNMYMIHLKQGHNETLVIYHFEMVDDKARDTWLGVEFPSLEPGTYNLSSATRIKYLSAYRVEPRDRFDGTFAEGKLTITERKDGYIAGHVYSEIKVVTKRTGNERQPKFVYFNGSFRIAEVPFGEAPKRVPVRRFRL